MTERTETQRQVLQVKKLVSMSEYQNTIGLWLRQLDDQALYDLSSAVEVPDVHRAQGAYRIIQALKTLIDRAAKAPEPEE